MDQLSDFKPLERVSLPDIGDLRCSGLILVVGPNSSGKSQLLQDIYLRISGEPRALVVATDVQVNKPQEYEPFARWLEDKGYFETFVDENGSSQWRPRTVYLGTGQAINQIQPNQAQNWYSAYVPTSDPSVRRRSEFLNYFGRLLVTALFLERRLTSLNQVGAIDFQTQSPQNDLHALYLDDTARERLYDELVQSFSKAVWPDMSRGNLLCVRVSDEGILPTAQDRLSFKKMAAYRSIETEGDGLKSYVAICVALLLGRRPVCLIDEPEMCLHPPQAYNLGRFMKSRLSSPLLAAGRKAGPPQAGNQRRPMPTYQLQRQAGVRYDHRYESSSRCRYCLSPGLSLRLSSPLPTGEPHRELGCAARGTEPRSV